MMKCFRWSVWVVVALLCVAIISYKWTMPHKGVSTGRSAHEVLLSEHVQKIMASHRRAWPLISNLSMQNDGLVDSKNSTLNIAMPSGDTTYVATVIPKGETYTFDGELPTIKDGILYSSLSVYDKKGLLVKDDQGQVQSWNMRNMPKIDALSITAKEGIVFVIQRFYKDKSTEQVDRKLYLHVKNAQGQQIKQASAVLQSSLTQLISSKLMDVIEKHAQLPDKKNAQFYMPASLTGLFPNADAGYAIATPAPDTAYVKITGVLPSADYAKAHAISYLSFMAVNYTSTATDASISFQTLGGFTKEPQPYTLYIASPGVDVSALVKDKNAHVLQWHTDTVNQDARGVVLRMLNTRPTLIVGKKYTDPDSLAQALGMYYPHIEYMQAQ